MKQQRERNYKLKPAGQSQAGFTIVELLIVLAVGGLMLLILLMAIPTLIRNGHNNQRRQDVQAILGAISHWELNNSGNIPINIQPALQSSKAKLYFYDAGNITIHGGSPGDPSSVNPSTEVDKVNVYNYQKCNTTNPGGSVAKGAGYSDVVALYTIETGDGVTGKCQQI